MRHEAAHRGAFTLTPDYLEHTSRGPAAGDVWFSDYGPQLSRDLKALEAWLAIKAHGLDAHAAAMERNVRQAEQLAERVRREPALELMTPPGLNIVCFRAVLPGLDTAGHEALNGELLALVHESGVAVPSYTTLGGRYCLRVAIANHRTCDEDVDRLVDTLLELAPVAEHAVAG